MTLVGIAVLSVEGMRATAATAGRRPTEPAHTKMLRAVALTGGLMLGLSTFQAEFDFGVPQFQLIFQPLMLMLAAGVGLVARPPLRRPRRRPRRGRLLHPPARRPGAAGRARCSARRCPTSRSTSPRRWWSRRSPSSSRPSRPLRFGLVAGARDRHRRPRGRVGLVPPLDAAPLAGGAPSPKRRSPGLPAPSPAATIGAWIGTRLSPVPRRRSPLLRRGRGLQRRGAGGAGRLRPLHAHPGGRQRPGRAARRRRRRAAAR